LALAAPARADNIFAVGSVKVDATAASATEARDTAIAQGRPIAWAKLYRRLTRSKDWPRQPQLDDQTLLHMIRGLEIANEKRSSTRYLAEITYDFNAPAVRKVLQQAGIAYSEASGKRVLVIPILAGKPFESASPWTQAWARGDLSNSLTPIVLPSGNTVDLDVLARSDLAALNWSTFARLAARYSASEVVVAEASENANAVTVRLVRVSSAGATVLSLPPRMGYGAAADAAVTSLSEAWKGRSVVDYGQKSKLTAVVSFSSGREWASIRTRLAAVPTVANVSIVGLSLNSAEIELAYVGQLPQLQDALTQQSLNLRAGVGTYSLRLSGADTP
jgi:hypothetical protein